MNDALVIEVVRKTVTVDCAVEEAFRIFTADAMSWWPVASHSIHGTVSEIVFEPHVGGEVYEVAESGETATGRPCSSGSRPSRLVLAWNILDRGRPHRGRGAVPRRGRRRRASSSSTAGGRTSELDAPTKRGDYDAGWGVVLGRYVDRAG